MSEPRTIPDFVIKTIFLNISLPPLGVPDLSLLLPRAVIRKVAFSRLGVTVGSQLLERNKVYRIHAYTR